jgi:hypothetical protein
MGAYDHPPYTVQGDVALPGTVREDVLRTLNQIGEKDPDTTVQNLAGRVARWLTYIKDRPLCSGPL